jgi:hypothetical protein
MLKKIIQQRNSFVLKFILIFSIVFSGSGITVFANPSVPTNLFSTNVAGTSATINWTGSTSATHYEIYRKLGSGTEAKVATVTESGVTTNELDIVILFDTSGSMSGEITLVKNELTNFVNTFTSANIDVRLGIVTFRGYCEPKAKLNFTSNLPTVINYINNITVGGGCSSGEDVFGAMTDETYGALNFPFRASANRQFIVVTDEPPDEQYLGHTPTTFLPNIISQLVQNNIRVTMIARTETTYSQWYNPVVLQTNGNYINITSTSYRSGLNTTANSIITNRSYNDTGLNEYSEYTYRIKACNGTTCSNFSNPLVVKTLDATAPTVPNNLTSTNKTTTSFTVNWDRSTDDGSGVKEYRVYANGSLISTVPVPSTSYTLTELNTPIHLMEVEAVDYAGNVSAKSAALSVDLNDEKKAPTALTLSNNKIFEYNWVDYEIGKFTTTDANVGDSFTYTFVTGQGSNDNSDFTIDGDTLKAAIVFDFLEQETHLIRVRTTDSTGLSYEEMFEIEVAQGNVTLNATNKIATVHFDDVIFDNSSKVPVPADTPKKTLNDLITITNEANVANPVYSPLGANDTVVVKKNTLVITFENQITGYYNRIKIAEKALIDRFYYQSGEQITTPIVVDVTGPKLIKTTMSKNKKKVTFRFNERIYMATAGAKPADVALSFRNAISIKRGSGSYGPLNSKDKVSVSGRVVEISLSNAFTTDDNRIKFAAEALKDLLSNKSLEIESPEIEDLTGPELNKVSLGSDNKTITILFDEEAFNVATGTKSEKLTALKNAIQFAENGTSFSPLGTTDTIDLTKGVLTIKFSTPITGSLNRIRIYADSLQDLFKNKNKTLETDPIVADAVGPVCKTPDEDDSTLCASVSLPSKFLNRRLTITFNERVSMVDKKTINNAVSLSTDGTYAPIGATAKVSTSRNQLVITLSKPLVVDKEYQVKVDADAIKDFFGNKNLALESTTFEVDTSGPKLR